MSQNGDRKRDSISFLINAQVRKSPASCRFVEEFRGSNEHAAKREKVINALRSGQLLEEADLQPVMAFLDREGFETMSVRDRQLLVLAKLQEYLGLMPQTNSTPVAVPVAPVQQSPAPAAEPEHKQPEEVAKPQPPVEATPTPTDSAPAPKNVKQNKSNTQLASFANKLTG